MCDQEPDYEELKAFTSSSSSAAVERPAEDQDMDTGSHKVHLQMQRLFLLPGGGSNPESHKPPVLKRISDRRRRVEAAQKDDDPTGESRPFPRLYPSIRLAMREIQQIQQVQTYMHRGYTLVQIPTWPLDYLHDVFPVFGPSVQMRMRPQVCVEFYTLDDGTHFVL